MAEEHDHESSKRRTRGAVACSSCRRRRVKCVKMPNETSCEQCRRNRLECVVRRDERKQQSSRAYLNYLKDRVDFLTTSLQEIGTQPPAAGMPQPPAASGTSDDNGAHPMPRQQPQQEQYPIPLSDDTIMSGSDDYQFAFQECMFDPILFAAPQYPAEDEVDAESPNRTLVNDLLSTTGHLKFDQSNGRWRYFGPTTNFHHISSEGSAALLELHEPLKQTKRVLRELSPETHDHLLESYWVYYNPIFQVVDREAFQDDKESGGTQYYSGFLHITILAMGFRFADKSRSDVQRLQLPGTRESTLHREAKYLSEYELERPGGLPSIQALVLLSSLESGCGRDNAGWMYAGMGFRLAFDVGLNLAGSRLGIQGTRDLRLRRKLLRSCVLLDRYWSLYLGRCNSIKSSDLPVEDLASRESQPADGDAPDIQEQIFEAFLVLMGICCNITDQLERIVSTADCNTLFGVAALDRELCTWHSSLPEQLVWNAERATTAPLNYFLLHQAYHCAMILLYRPFTLYEVSASRNQADLERTTTQMAIIARKICCDNAVNLAQIFGHLTQRCEPGKVTLYAVQQAGAAAAVLIAALKDNRDEHKRSIFLRHLHFLADILRQMAATYQPAEKMSMTLDRILEDPLYQQSPPTTGFRRSSSSTSHQRPRLIDDFFAEETLNNRDYGALFSGSADLSDTFDAFLETHPSSLAALSTSCALQQQQHAVTQSHPGPVLTS